MNSQSKTGGLKRLIPPSLIFIPDLKTDNHLKMEKPSKKNITPSNKNFVDKQERYVEIYKLTSQITKKSYIGQAVSHILNNGKYRKNMEWKDDLHLMFLKHFQQKRTNVHT